MPVNHDRSISLLNFRNSGSSFTPLPWLTLPQNHSQKMILISLEKDQRYHALTAVPEFYRKGLLPPPYFPLALYKEHTGIHNQTCSTLLHFPSLHFLLTCGWEAEQNTDRAEKTETISTLPHTGGRCSSHLLSPSVIQL